MGLWRLCDTGTFLLLRFYLISAFLISGSYNQNLVIIPSYAATQKFEMPGLLCNTSEYIDVTGAVVTSSYTLSNDWECTLRFRSGRTDPIKFLFFTFSEVNINNCNVMISVFFSYNITGDPDLEVSCNYSGVNEVVENRSRFLSFVLNRGLQEPDTFQIVVTAIYQVDECDPPYVFQCDNQHCVSSGVACDVFRTNNCFDNSDEVTDSNGNCIAKKAGTRDVNDEWYGIEYFLEYHRLAPLAFTIGVALIINLPFINCLTLYYIQKRIDKALADTLNESDNYYQRFLESGRTGRTSISMRSKRGKRRMSRRSSAIASRRSRTSHSSSQPSQKSTKLPSRRKSLASYGVPRAVTSKNTLDVPTLQEETIETIEESITDTPPQRSKLNAIGPDPSEMLEEITDTNSYTVSIVKIDKKTSEENVASTSNV